MASADWLLVSGRSDSALAQTLEQRISDRVASGKLSREEIGRIALLDLSVGGEKLDLSNETLDKLRRLCQLWDVDIRHAGISSHRPVLGPVIVAVKKLVYPLLRMLLKDTLRQQRDFNAAVVSLMAELANRSTGAK